MVKIDFTRPVPSLNGKPRKNPDKDKSNFLLRDAVILVLDGQSKEDINLPAKEKYRRGELATKIYAAKGPLELAVEDVSLIKELLGRLNSNIIIFETTNMVDAKPGNTTPDRPEPAARIPGRKAKP